MQADMIVGTWKCREWWDIDNMQAEELIIFIMAST